MKKKNIFLLLITLTFLCACMSETETIYDYSYKEVKEVSGATSWIFEGSTKPPIKLSDSSEFMNCVNSVLDSIGLPYVNMIVEEKYSFRTS